jgi:acetyltransferase-like isoleucine patch superfamily enzyme
MRQNEMHLSYRQAEKLYWEIERDCNYHLAHNFYPIVWKRLAEYLDRCQREPYQKQVGITIRARSNMSAGALRSMLWRGLSMS